MAALKNRATLMVLALLALLAASSFRLEARPLYRRARSRMRPWNILRWNADADLSVAGLEYYVQLVIGETDLQELLPAINTTTSNNFGSTELFMLNVTEEADPDSTLLGYVRGYTVQASYTSDAVGVEVEVLYYDDGTLNGTVSIQGLVFNGPNEVAIVGGTGDFRGVSGYGIITFVNASGDYRLFHHELHFVYDLVILHVLTRINSIGAKDSLQQQFQSRPYKIIWRWIRYTSTDLRISCNSFAGE